jgi:hypothetical protein
MMCGWDQTSRSGDLSHKYPSLCVSGFQVATIEVWRPLPQGSLSRGSDFRVASPCPYGFGIIFTFGNTLTPPPPVAFGAHMLVVPSFSLKSGFHPPSMLTVPVLLHTGSAGVKVFAA